LSIRKRPSPTITLAGTGIQGVVAVSSDKIGDAKALKAANDIVHFNTVLKVRLRLTPMSLASSSLGFATFPGTPLLSGAIPADSGCVQRESRVHSRCYGFVTFATRESGIYALNRRRIVSPSTQQRQTENP